MFENPPWRLKLALWTLNITTIVSFHSLSTRRMRPKTSWYAKVWSLSAQCWSLWRCLPESLHFFQSVAVSVASAIVPVNAALSRTETITIKHAFIRPFHCYQRFKWILLFYCRDMQSSRSHQPWQCDCNGSGEVCIYSIGLKKKKWMLNIRYMTRPILLSSKNHPQSGFNAKLLLIFYNIYISFLTGFSVHYMLCLSGDVIWESVCNCFF